MSISILPVVTFAKVNSRVWVSECGTYMVTQMHRACYQLTHRDAGLVLCQREDSAGCELHAQRHAEVANHFRLGK